MPDIPGRMKSEGYISPAPPYDAPKEVKEFMAKTYGGLRKNRFPGESKENKERAARITWYQTKRKFDKKYPELFRKHKGHAARDPPEKPYSERQVARGTRMELKEHPQLGIKGAREVAIQHLKLDPNEYSTTIKTPDLHVPVPTKPAETEAERREQVRDIHAAAKERRAWANEAQSEGIEEAKRGNQFKKQRSPVRGNVLADDSKLAKGFAKGRRELAKDLDMQAARIAAMDG